MDQKKAEGADKMEDSQAAAPAQDENDHVELEDIEIDEIKRMPVFLKKQFKSLMDEMRKNMLDSLQKVETDFNSQL